MTDWWNYGGLTRDVKLIETPQTFVRDYTIQLQHGSQPRHRLGERWTVTSAIKKSSFAFLKLGSVKRLRRITQAQRRSISTRI
jgi:hypothetical protein